VFRPRSTNLNHISHQFSMMRESKCLLTYCILTLTIAADQLRTLHFIIVLLNVCYKQICEFSALHSQHESSHQIINSSCCSFSPRFTPQFLSAEFQEHVTYEVNLVHRCDSCTEAMTLRLNALMQLLNQDMG
jgi:hypothetical protein